MSSRERIAALKRWVADRRNRDRQPPVHLDPPGAHARAHPTRAEIAGVRSMIETHSHEVAALPRSMLAPMLPLLEQAKREVARDLQHWLKTVPDGNLRFTAQRMSGALVALRGATNTIRKLEPELADTLKDVRHRTAQLSTGHLVHEVARMSSVFDGYEVKLHIKLATVVASGERFLLPLHETSAARYAGEVMTDIRAELAKGLVLNETISEMTDRLVAIGGPKGRVALRGVAGKPGAVTQAIAEGLFRRYRWWATRIVRDQVAAAYTFQALAGYFDARQILPDLEKRWDASVDRHTCPECAALDGVTVPLESLFPGGVEGSPLHSCCRCRSGCMRPHWNALLKSIGVEPLSLAA